MSINRPIPFPSVEPEPAPDPLLPLLRRVDFAAWEPLQSRYSVILECGHTLYASVDFLRGYMLCMECVPCVPESVQAPEMSAEAP